MAEIVRYIVHVGIFSHHAMLLVLFKFYWQLLWVME